MSPELVRRVLAIAALILAVASLLIGRPEPYLELAVIILAIAALL